MCEKKNVLLIVLDTVRARSTSVNDRQTTPTIERVAQRGTCFDRAVAPASWTLPSHASMYTGLYPTEHGAVTHNSALPSDHTTLAELLRDDGYATGVFAANGFLTETFNMLRGFEESVFIDREVGRIFDDAFDYVRFSKENTFETRLEKVQAVASQIAIGPVGRNFVNLGYYAIQSMKRRMFGLSETYPRWDHRSIDECSEFIQQKAGERPFFAMVNLIQAHGPWPFDRDRIEATGVTPEDIAPIERWEWVADHSEDQWEYASGEQEFDELDQRILTHLYESWVQSVDAAAGRLLDILESAGILDETLVIITADHGEAIAVDGVLGHRLSVHDDVAHVPLAIAGPDVPETTVTDTVSVKDIFGTVTSETGVAPDAPSLLDVDARGTALIETYGGDCKNVAEQYRETCETFGTRRALYVGNRRVERRYATDEVTGDESMINELTDFVATMDNRVERTGSTVELTDDISDRLERLGYIDK